MLEVSLDVVHHYKILSVIYICACCSCSSTINVKIRPDLLALKLSMQQQLVHTFFVKKNIPTYLLTAKTKQLFLSSDNDSAWVASSV